MSIHSLWLMPLCAVLWRLQGGAWFASRLPGRPVFYIAPLIGIISAMVDRSAYIGAAVAVALIWASFIPHGRWFSLEHLDRSATNRAPSLFERSIEAIVDKINPVERDDALCLLFAKAVAFMPLAMIPLFVDPTWEPIGAIGILTPVIVVLGYAIGWSMFDGGKISTPTAFGEFAAGISIGAVVAVAVA